MLPRPTLHLDRFPHDLKWEFTRRHPLYLQLWEVKRAADSQGIDWMSVQSPESILAAKQILQISGDPADPSLSFEELSRNDSENAFFRSSLEPVKVKQILGIIAQQANPTQLRRIANTLEQLADGQDGLTPPDVANEGLADLVHSTDNALEAIIDGPIYQVSPIAAREDWEADMVACQSHWCERLGLEPTRLRRSDIENYLRAWDLCEGFQDGDYRREQIQSIRRAATTLGNRPERTVSDWYHRGFQLIFGHDFSFQNWLRCMGLRQLSGWFAGSVSPISRGRVRRDMDGRNHEVAETTLYRETDAGLIANQPAQSTSESEAIAELRGAARVIASMIDDGLSPGQIRDQMVGEPVSNQQLEHAIVFLIERDDVRASLRGTESPSAE